MIHFRSLLLATAAFLLSAAVFAQTTKVRGKVTDASSGEPLPYVSVFFDGTSIGVSTDEEGRYHIETHNQEAVVLKAQILGYRQAEARIQPGAFSEVDFALELDADVLTAARIRPDDRWIRYILRQVDAHREQHDRELGDPWAVRVYSKIELDATHAEWLATKTALRGVLGDVVKYRDTSAVTGESYIPIALSETISQKYHSSEPPGDREVIVANRISGMDPDNFLRQYSGTYLLKTNFYKGTITLFNLDVPSPASAFGHAFYDYYLVDSLALDGRKTYCLRFHPKRGITAPTFDGEFYIDAEDFGIRSARVALSRQSNVNWIRHINIDAENRRCEDGRWFPKEEKLFIDFSIAVRDSAKIVSFLANRELHYDEPRQEAIPPEIARNPDAVVTSLATEMDDALWASERPVPLSPREQGIYTMIAELQQKPAYKAWYTLARSLVVGYVEGENTKVAYGPWAQTVKYNATEGLHVGVGFRTTKFLHPDIRFSAQLGYGFRDHLLKGGGSVEYMMRRDVTRKLTLSGSYDYQQLGQGSSGLTQQGLFSTLLSGRTGDKQTLMRDLEMQYEHEFSPTFSAYFSLESKRLFGNGLVPLYTRDSVFVKSISINQFRVIGRFAWEERINRGHFSKAHIFTRYPIIMFDLAYGIQGLRSNVHAGSYFRGEMSFDWHIPAGMMGFGSIHLDGGAILGEVPYPFLKLHAGNPLMLLDKTAFSCMDYYEFASDRWGTLMYEHNLNGLILGRIPLIKYLDLREIITVKAAIGTLSDANRRGTILPIEGLASLEKPYVEAGVGLSNLFRVIRMDAVWRLTNRRPDSRNFQVTLGFDVQF